jgi:OOP family OmpA-OmpF porin
MRKLGLAVFAAGMFVATNALAFGGWYVSDELRALQAASATGSPFNAALKQEYQALCDEALKESDHLHAARYCRKGWAAARGGMVLPEAPSTWLIPHRARAELADNHGKLLAALDGGGRSRNPAAAARAQAMFDCWVEEEHEDIWWRAPGMEMPVGGGYYQPGDVQRCKEGFLAAMQELLGAPQQAFIIFFAFDRANLDGAAMRVIGDIVAAAKRAPQARVSIFGHTDTAGSAAYNLGLSKRRAEAVRGALAARGVAPSRMAASGFGETRLRVPTPDGTPNAQNRRAEITVQ